MRKLLLQTNGEMLQTEHKGINDDVEAIEKKEIHATKRVRLHSYIHSNKFHKDIIF
jgi:hypothetical protein